ncbi:hypothetical protein GGR77_003836 [Xanthomonas translucens]
MGLLLGVVILCFCEKSQAAAQLVWLGQITYVENGWYGEGMVIHTANAGPSGCSAPPNDFAIEKSNPSYQELTAMALTAYTKNMDVGLVVDSGGRIFGGRTKVISIRLQK